MDEPKRELARYRLEKAREHLKSADKLLQEKLFRDSISRSYYAVFSAVRAILALKDLDSKKHSGVTSLFSQHFVKTSILPVEASKIVKEARSYRESVDYEDFLVITEEEAKKQHENAAKLIEMIQKKIEELLA